MATNKNQRVLRRMKVSAPAVIDRNQLDKFIIDTTLKALYENSDIDTLDLENQIYKPNGIQLSRKEAERIWSVMIATGWINPVIGFGNAGKVALSREGYQLMAQYGGYAEYLNAINASQQQAIILPFTEEPKPSDGETVKEQDKQKAAKKQGNDKPQK